jgi:exodeoxyribonuclease VII small subunit
MSKRQVNKEHRDRIEAWRKDAEGLSYEEAMQALDLLLAELQNDNVALADLQQKVLHGEVYLSRCQKLLDSVEQSIIELDPTTLKATNDA